jgi:hypothetical protein
MDSFTPNVMASTGGARSTTDLPEPTPSGAREMENDHLPAGLDRESATARSDLADDIEAIEADDVAVRSGPAI